jgi:hypothetical protein
MGTEVTQRNVGRPDFLPYDEVLAHRADAALLDELREMLPETTDDIDDPWEKAAESGDHAAG